MLGDHRRADGVGAVQFGHRGGIKRAVALFRQRQPCAVQQASGDQHQIELAADGRCGGGKTGFVIAVEHKRMRIWRGAGQE